MRSLQRYTWLAALLLLPAVVFSQDDYDRRNRDHNTSLGAAFTFAAPTHSLSNTSDFGFGLHVLADKEITNILSLTGAVGWMNFFGKNNLGNRNGFLLEAGGKAQFSMVYIAGRFGYAFGDFNHLIFTPAAGLRFKNLDLNIGYQLAGQSKWIPFRVGYFFNTNNRR
jgi:hypothetical protein